MLNTRLVASKFCDIRRSISKCNDNELAKLGGEISPIEAVFVEKNQPPPYIIVMNFFIY